MVSFSCRIRTIIFCCTLFCALLVSSFIRNTTYNDFHNNQFLQENEFHSVFPLILPENHPVKPILDSIFLSQRVILTKETLENAGFIIKYSQPRSFIIVAQHPLLPGYLLKLYLDSELRLKRNAPGWEWLVKRVKSARIIEKIIYKKNIQHFVVPKKWIYPLPMTSIPEDGREYSRKNEILIVQDMNLASKEESKKAWKYNMTAKHLQELHSILLRAGGGGYRPDNIAYTKDGKFAFIDTEYYQKSVNLQGVARYLSPKMAKKWRKIIKSHKN